VAKEIYQAWTAAGTLYALIRRPADNYVWDPSIATPAFVAWVDGNIANYDIAMTPTGRVHLADFPTTANMIAGTYDVFVMLQASASPAITDSFISQGQICWDGAAEILLSDINSSVIVIDGIVGTINTNVSAVLTAQKMVNTTYNPSVIDYTKLGKL
jgi:hypothetical protein